MKKAKQELDTTTEEKIKSAARSVFHQKGFAATRTRDIATEAGINLALLNYYFRSKEKLFEIIMLETLKSFMESLVHVYNDDSTSLENKVELLAKNYIDLLLVEPEIPLFLMSELRSNPTLLFEKINIKELILQSVLFKQINEAILKGKVSQQNPLHFLSNMMGLIMFPFISSPMLKLMGGMDDKQFKNLMTERKRLIPLWVKAMMSIK